MTSPEACAALQELPKINPVLHRELTGIQDELEPTTAELEDMVEELVFNECVEDDCDIPLSIVEKQLQSLMSAPSNEVGFAIESDGSIVRISVSEDADAEVLGEEVAGDDAHTETAELGRGHRLKKATVPFGGHRVWDCE